MDHTYFVKLWFEARKDLEQLIKYDENIKNGPPIEETEAAINEILLLYFRCSALKLIVLCCICLCPFNFTILFTAIGK
jgi:hypothetical protein